MGKGITASVEEGRCNKGRAASYKRYMGWWEFEGAMGWEGGRKGRMKGEVRKVIKEAGDEVGGAMGWDGGMRKGENEVQCRE